MKANPSPLDWIPHGIDIDALPSEVRSAITDILYPACQELVVGAADPLERDAATTYIHLWLLGLIHQFELGKEIDRYGFAASAEMMVQHLRLVKAKQQTASFLLRAKVLKGK